jgi:hypothetical protein
MKKNLAGRHNPLSKALSKGYFFVARYLLHAGAPVTCIACTDMLAATGFDPHRVAWLIDAAIELGLLEAMANKLVIIHVLQACVLDCLQVCLGNRERTFKNA